jgi:hypothetical protein
MGFARRAALLSGAIGGSALAAIAALASDGPPARDAAPPPVAPPAPAPTTFATPWPARSPCAHPVTLLLDEGLASDAVWSSDDGDTALRFPPQGPDKPVGLARTFPGDRLRRVAVGALPKKLRFGWLLRLGCRGDAAIEWGPCANEACGVRATYGVPRMVRPWRTEHWTTPTRAPVPYDDWPDVHYSRFKQRIGWRKAGDAEIERQSLRLTRDIIADLRDCLTAACAGGRCAEPIQAAESRLRAYVADHDPRYVLIEHTKAYIHWNTGWTWEATAGETKIKVSCTDIAESTQVFCSLELDVGGGLRVVYFPRNAAGSRGFDVAIADRPHWDDDHLLGKIGFEESRLSPGAAWLEISGGALALQRATDRAAPAH